MKHTTANHKITALLITFNEIEHIDAILKNINFADEIIVVDSYSTDGTAERIKAHENVTLIQRAFKNYTDQKAFALEQANNEWILFLDADERVSEALKNEIIEITTSTSPTSAAYFFYRTFIFENSILKFSGSRQDKNYRLFKKSKVKYVKSRIVHETLDVDGSYGTLKNKLIHYSYKDYNTYKRKLVKYGHLKAIEDLDKNYTPNIYHFILRPFFKFITYFIFKLGFLDGKKGLIISYLNALGVYERYKELKRLRKPNYKADFSCSLIISTYKWPDALNLVLKSIMEQEIMPNEILIADDGSGAETKRIITEYQKKCPIPLKHFWHEDTGFTKTIILNKTISEAKYDYIIQIDGDIITHPKFIKDHIDFSEENCWINGSRVLLSPEKSEEILQNEDIHLSIFTKKSTNRLNALHSSFLRDTFFAKKELNIDKTRGCNMSYWKSDFIKINGYNEDITGWGREDSEFTARLINNGIYKKSLKFGGIEFHIYHPEASRNQLEYNNDIQETTINSGIKYCTNGLIKHT